eukprot:3113134-Pleurochrysis_carterae.AAC.1
MKPKSAPRCCQYGRRLRTWSPTTRRAGPSTQPPRIQRSSRIACRWTLQSASRWSSCGTSTPLKRATS